MAVSEATFLWVVGGGAAAISTVATAAYFNRRKLNQLYQRLFGLEADRTDDGYIVEMDRKLDELKVQMNDQHGEVLQAVQEGNGEGSAGGRAGPDD